MKTIEIEIDRTPAHGLELAQILSEAVLEYAERFDDVIEPGSVTVGDKTYEP